LVSIETPNSFTAAQRTLGRANLGAAINELQNVSFAVSASAGALTIALKDVNGNDATATTPVTLTFRNASLTASPNTPTVIEVQAATSVVVPSTSTLGTVSATGFRIWIIGWNDGGTFRLGVFNASTPNNIFPLQENGVASSLQVVAAGNSAGQHYTAGAAVTSKAFRVLGYVDWNASGVATAGTWTTTNLNSITTYGPTIPLPGRSTGQIARVTSNTPTTNTTATYASTNLTEAISLSSAANFVKYTITGPVFGSATTSEPQLQMFRGSTGIGTTSDWFSNNSAATDATATLNDIDFPNVLGSQTYTLKLRQANGASTAQFLSAGLPGNMLLEEIMG
jgi:hypothetical protein